MSETIIQSKIPFMIDAVNSELEKIHIAKKTITLFEGKLISQKDNDYIYKFEIPEGTRIGQIEECEIIIGNEKVDGDVLSIDNQFITLQISINLGGFITELTIEWSSDLILRKLIERLSRIKDKPLNYNLELSDLLFHPVKTKITRKANNYPIKTDNKRNVIQYESIRGALTNKISFIWGPPGTGKTSTLGFIAYNLIKENKKVIFATNTNRAVDVAILQLIDAYKFLKDEKFIDEISRYGHPFILNNPDLESVYFENQIEEIRKKLKEKIKYEIELYREYREIKVKLAQYKEYFDELKSLAEQLISEKQVLDVVLSNLKVLKDKLDNYDNVGLLENLARIFMGDSLDTIQKKYNTLKLDGIKQKEKLDEIKSRHQSLLDESPVAKTEIDRFDKLSLEIDKYGGEKKLGEFIDSHLSVDEISIIKQKSFIAATLAKIVTNDIFFHLDCDTLIIDEGSMVSLPYLVVLSSLVKDRVIIVGDPQQLPPISMSESELSKKWLEKDIYMYASNSIDVDDLFDWNIKNPDFTFFLDTQYRMSGKLCKIISDHFYKGKLKNGNNQSANELGGICFIDTSSLNPTLDMLPGRKKFAPYNVVHTERIIEILQYLAINRFYNTDEIGIVLPLNASVQYVRKELRKNGLGRIEVGTVHTFQGREKQFIIFDTVMSGVNFTIRPFDDALTGDKVKRLLNVALSRSKQILFVIANNNHFNSLYKGKFIVPLLKTLKENSIQNISITEDASKYDQLSSEEQSSLIDDLLYDNHSVNDAKQVVSNVKNQSEDVIDIILDKPKSKDEKLIDKEIQKYGREITAIRYEINSLSSQLKNKTLFRPSIECEKITSLLPRYIVGNETDFKNWIDMMYKYFYESSGGKNAEYPLVDKSNKKYKIRWEINRLRNSFFHDIEQSKYSDVEKQKVQNIYNSIIGKGYPTDTQEWSNIQISIMYHTLEWLNVIFDKLKTN
ncbi:MAG: AAA family ATPase [Candidatus Delongbacteria bacterium]|nr:AAA family ATPase [Candidatus Delongbacteria bacterium]